MRAFQDNFCLGVSLDLCRESWMRRRCLCRGVGARSGTFIRTGSVSRAGTCTCTRTCTGPSTGAQQRRL